MNDRPNIVYFQVDNLGYGELGCYGGGILALHDHASSSSSKLPLRCSKRARQLLLLLVVSLAGPASADEGGVSFWLPGNFGSFAAAPGAPGWSFGSIYYHATTDAGATRSFPVGGRVTAGLDARADLLFVSPTYIAATPIAGGQASFGIAGAFGGLTGSVTATLQGPRGNVFSGGPRDARQGAGDLYPTASLRWSSGHHNGMVYTMGGIPVGAYDVDRLANLGTNHWSLDGGGGYTYLDSQKGHEFSAVLGFTYNWENPDTDYQNGIDGHLDWAASQFVSETTHVGVVGYLYQQVTGDSGAGATLGPFKSQVAGIGPQVGHFFAFGGGKAYFNLKGIYEFDAENRPSGWNTWVTVSIPLE